LVDKKEGMRMCRAKTKALDSSRRARSTFTPDATLRALGEARQVPARGLDAGAGRQTARGSHGLAGEVLGEPVQVRVNSAMEQSFTAETFRCYQRFEQPAGSSTRTKRRAHQGFLLLNSNYCELGHPTALMRISERYVVAALRNEIICLRYTLRL
jgi:hypothetical protein